MHRRGCHLLVLLCLAAKAAAGACGSTPQQCPLLARTTQATQHLNASDRSSIRAAHEAERHAIKPVGAEAGIWLAGNPGQQWRTRFDGRGFLTSPLCAPEWQAPWTWGLALETYGSAAGHKSVAQPTAITAENGRITYRWDAELTEWFVNDRRGLEHGYTIQCRPDPARLSDADVSTPLTISLAVRGSLRADVNEGGQELCFRDSQGITILTYAGLKVWDLQGRVLPAWLEAPTPETVRLSIDDRGACYPLTVDPIAQQAYLKASNTDAEDIFGWSVAISGDTAVVGAPWEDSNGVGVNASAESDNSATDSGAAYVFVQNDGVWAQQACLKSSNTQAFDEFGTAVAISGNVLIVGAPNEDSGGTGVNSQTQADNSSENSGAAYVFVRNNGVWAQQAYLKSSNTDVNDRFGSAVAISGNTAVVGAPLESTIPGFTDGTGGAYVFVNDGTGWSQQANLNASNAEANDNFGSAVAISGDSLIIGAPYESSAATGVTGAQGNDLDAFASGAAYVFARRANEWTQQAYLKASNTGANDNFGSAVGISGDTAVVGAFGESSDAAGVNGPQTNDNADFSGAAYIFVRSEGTWSQQSYLKASNPQPYDHFGLAVAIAGETVVIGSPGESSNATGVDGDEVNTDAPGSGAAYLFQRHGTEWTQQGYLKASNTDRNDSFGRSVAISGYTVLAGAPQESSDSRGVNSDQTNSGAVESGAAYLFSLDSPPTLSLPFSPIIVEAAANCQTVVTFGVSANDPEDGSLTPTITANGEPVSSGHSFPLGDTTVVVTATDSAGNAISDHFVVSVRDTTDPVLTCPPLQAVRNDGNGGATVSYPAVSAVDSCPGSVVCTPLSGSRFPIGINVVTCTARDSSNNDSSCTFIVYVKPSNTLLDALFTDVKTLVRVKANVKKALLAKLETAQTALNADDPLTACARLRDFIALVDAQKARRELTAGQATLLVAEALTARTTLHCP